MKEKLDWDKLLGIKRKKDINNKNSINKEIPNNSIIKNNFKKQKLNLNPKSKFENEISRLKNIFNKFQKTIPSFIEKRSFSFKELLSKQLNIKLINLEKRKIDFNSKTTNYYTINSEKIIEEKDISDNFKNFDMEQKLEAPIIPNLYSINNNCK